MKVWEAELTFHLTQLCHSWSFQNIAGINCQGSLEVGVQDCQPGTAQAAFSCCCCSVTSVILHIDRDLLKCIFPCWNSYLCSAGVSEELACHKGYCDVHDFTNGVLSVGNSQCVLSLCINFSLFISFSSRILHWNLVCKPKSNSLYMKKDAEILASPHSWIVIFQLVQELQKCSQLDVASLRERLEWDLKISGMLNAYCIVFWALM